jgi:chromosome segregation ATPase
VAPTLEFGADAKDTRISSLESEIETAGNKHDDLESQLKSVQIKLDTETAAAAFWMEEQTKSADETLKSNMATAAEALQVARKVAEDLKVEKEGLQRRCAAFERRRDAWDRDMAKDKEAFAKKLEEQESDCNVRMERRLAEAREACDLEQSDLRATCDREKRDLKEQQEKQLRDEFDRERSALETELRQVRVEGDNDREKLRLENSAAEKLLNEEAAELRKQLHELQDRMDANDDKTADAERKFEAANERIKSLNKQLQDAAATHTSDTEKLNSLNADIARQVQQFNDDLKQASTELNQVLSRPLPSCRPSIIVDVDDRCEKKPARTKQRRKRLRERLHERQALPWQNSV